MKILCALNSFKGTFSSKSANKSCFAALKKIFPEAEIKSLAVSDGGDGFLDCFRNLKGAKKVKIYVCGPLPKTKVRAEYVICKKEAFIEIAEACGIKYLKNKKLEPLTATTYGVGEIIKDAVNRKADKIYLGLGGTASSDGGFGMAKALGFKFLDKKGKEIENSVKGLLKLKKIKPPENIFFKKNKFFAVTDVKNPLLGKYGTANVYSPQKGANKYQVKIIEKAMRKMALRFEKDLGKKAGKIKGGGAAGGLGAGLYAFLDAQIKNGASFVSEKIKIGEIISQCDAVFTGEGIWDKTDFYGKMPYHLCQIARKNKKKSFCVCFENKTGRNYPFDRVIEIKNKFGKDFSLKNPFFALKKTVESERENIKQKLVKNSKISS
ncbi:MAG: glycerate kinase [Elusimicrobia bacterium]|nr:glycerate kinase [Elusimicrobiota bacterium]